MRGIDSEGHVANFVETEQIAIYGTIKASFVQVCVCVCVCVCLCVCLCLCVCVCVHVYTVVWEKFDAKKIFVAGVTQQKLNKQNILNNE